MGLPRSSIEIYNPPESIKPHRPVCRLTQGSVYKQVIDKVLLECQTTFEEDGVNHQTLDDLRFKKLSDLRVGMFPWDPPLLPQPMANPMLVHTLGSTLDPMSGLRPQIKQEARDEPLRMPTLPPNYNLNNEARERAMANLQDKFGATANAQISQLQRQVAMNQPSSQNSSLNHDGPADWTTFVQDRRQLSLKQQQDQLQTELEGGGLMLPLSEQRRKIGSRPVKTVVGQTDGADEPVKDELFEEEEEEDNDDDADAINSDLDDPDELEVEEDEEDGKPTQVMLCTYDKVQRVKNKWKCTLRDGVLNSNGKEYVFGKASGEFEW